MSEPDENPVPEHLRFPTDMVVAVEPFAYLLTKDVKDDQSIYWLWTRTSSTAQALPFDEEGIRKLIVRATELLKE